MELREPAHERQPDAEPARGASRILLALRKQVEDPRQERGRDADAAVLHADAPRRRSVRAVEIRMVPPAA